MHSPKPDAAAPGWSTEFGLLAALWGSSFLFTRIAAVEFGSLPTAALRVGIASLVLLPLLCARGLWAPMRRHWRALALVGALNSGLPFALYAFAVQHISTGLSSILNATTPLFGALVARLWLQEKLQRRQLLGLLLGFSGVVLLAWNSVAWHAPAAQDGWAVLACLGATMCYALSASLSQKQLPGLPPLVTATGCQLGGLAVLLLPALSLHPAVWPGARAWMAVGLLGVLCSGVAYLLYFRLIDLAGSTRALTVTYLVPVFAMVYGSWLLDEHISAWMLACAGLIGLGTALSSGLFGPRARGS